MCVVGPGGAGKSRLAAALAERTGLPLVALDRCYWRPGWVAPEPPRPVAKQVTALAAAPRWVLDGNYGGTAAIRFVRADTVIFLDLPRRVTIPSVLERTIRQWHRPLQASGCPEHLDRQFLRYLWRWPSEGRSRLIDNLEQSASEATVVRLRSRREAQHFLSVLPHGIEAG